MRDRGFDSRDICKGTGFDCAELGQDRTYAGDYVRLIHNCLELTTQPDLGLHVGRTVLLSEFGLYGYAILISSQMKDARNFGAQYFTMAGTTMNLAYTMEGNDLNMRTTTQYELSPAIYRYVVDYTNAALLTLIRVVTQDGLSPTEARFAIDRAEDVTLYEKTYGCPVHFGCRENVLLFSADPTLSLPMADPDSERLLHKQCEAVVAERHYNENRFLDRIRAVIMERLGKPLSLESVARQFGLSASTLKRRLQTEGVSYHELVQETRVDLAKDLFDQPSLTVEDVSYLCGYEDPASFRRAFKRWTGMTASEYRRH